MAGGWRYETFTALAVLLLALFFYAGHGLQVDGRNYLAPVDLKLERKQDLSRRAIELADVLEVMRGETNLVILDACRNNPLAGELARRLGLSRGLARVDSASGTLIAYATEPAAPEETAKSVEAALGLGIPERRLIQLGLAAEGFDPGDADGLFGRKTCGAIGRWQSSRGEEATEHLDVESAKLLMASGRKRQAQEQEAARQAAAEAERLRGEQEAREQAQREAQERARREAEERARREAAAVAERRRRAMEPGRRFRDCDACPEMVMVPSGSFLMGSPTSEAGRFDNEGPQHRVTIAEPFAVGVHEVTRVSSRVLCGKRTARWAIPTGCGTARRKKWWSVRASTGATPASRRPTDIRWCA